MVLSCQRRLSICLDENGERDDREMDNIDLDDLSDSDDELWLICFVLLNDVIYMFLYCLSMDPLRSEMKLYYYYYGPMIRVLQLVPQT